MTLLLSIIQPLTYSLLIQSLENVLDISEFNHRIIVIAKGLDMTTIELNGYSDINDIKNYDDDLVIDSGSPHYITFSENIT